MGRMTSEFSDITQQINTSNLSASGILNIPTYSFGSGTIDVSSCEVVLNSESDGNGTYAEYTLTNDTFTVTGEWVNNYIIADYNSGSPILSITTDSSDINGFSVVGIFTVSKNSSGSILRCVKWENLF